jgi:V/A-type H+-transporting ATPase subunit C
MPQKKTVSINRYIYASGRIRGLENKLMDSAQLTRLLNAAGPADIDPVLDECGYPEAADPEDRAALETQALYALLQRLFPEKGYLDVFLVQHDFHNLKVILKSLTQAWTAARSSEERTGEDALPESSGSYSLVSPAVLDPLLLRPSLVDPHILFKAIRDRVPSLVPAWAYAAAVQAAGQYLRTYDISDIDIALDRLAGQAALDRAAPLGNAFLNDYLALKADLTNLGLLIRTRRLRSGPAYLRKVLLPGGQFAEERVAALYPETPEAIRDAYAATPYAQLAAFADTYGQPGEAGRFSLIADNLVISRLRRTFLLWRGPEILLSYLIAREMEIKNIRIVLTCLRNGLPLSQARDLTRDSYQDWR